MEYVRKHLRISDHFINRRLLLQSRYRMLVSSQFLNIAFLSLTRIFFLLPECEGTALSHLPTARKNRRGKLFIYMREYDSFSD